MTITLSSRLYDTFSPYIGQNTAEFIFRVENSRTFVVELLQADKTPITDAKLQLFVQRNSLQSPFLVAESEPTFHSGYLLHYKWVYWPSDDDNFNFTLKALLKDQVVSERQIISGRTDLRRSQRLELNLRIKEG